MIKATLSNEILRYITEIDKNKYKVSEVLLPATVANKWRKNSKKKSSYASTKIEGNPLSEKQVDEVIDSDERKHYLKPEQEVRNYFLRMVLLYSNRVCELSTRLNGEVLEGSFSYLKDKEKELLFLLIKKYKREFTPIEVSKELKVTNRTVINRLAMLVKNGFVIPNMGKERIRSYELSDFTKQNAKELLRRIRK
jgi:hypothetical protein